MKISPFSLMKPETTGKVVKVIAGEGEELSSAFAKRLLELGAYEGQDIHMVRRNANIFRVKILDGTYAIDEQIAKKIIVKAKDGDVFESEFASRKFGDSFLNDLKDLWTLVKKQFKK